LYLLGSVVVIIFVILLFKFESGLREISPSIDRSKSSGDEE